MKELPIFLDTYFNSNGRAQKDRKSSPRRRSVVGAEVAVAKVSDAGNDVELLVDLRVAGRRQDFHLRKRVSDGVDARLGHQQGQQNDAV